MLARSLVVTLALAALLAACSGGSTTPGPTGTKCGPSAPCAPPTYCDPVRLVCVMTPDTGVQPRTEAGIPIDGPYVPPTGDGPYVPPAGDGPVQPPPDSGTPPSCGADEQWCDTRCVNTRVNLQHCGACNNSCGPMSGSHARCNNGTCECYQPWENCDGNWATNGCECGTGCDGAACKVTGCDPNVAGSCGTETSKYCSSVTRTCEVCSMSPTPWSNCDLLGGCECKVTSYSCINGQCQ